MKSYPSSRTLALTAAAVLALPAVLPASPISVSQNTDATADVLLQSYSADGKSFSNFVLASNARVLFTSPANAPQPHSRSTGTLSVDKGLNASGLDHFENPTDAEVGQQLGNLNLNNIIDVEDNGKFALDVMFSRTIRDNNAGADGVGELLVFERGKNSEMTVQALDAQGNLIGTELTLLRQSAEGSLQVNAGYEIHTNETGRQFVGLSALDLNLLGVEELSGLRIGVPEDSIGFNGPDFKVVGVDTGVSGGEEPHPAPEPSTAVLAFLAAATAGASRLRRKLGQK